MGAPESMAELSLRAAPCLLFPGAFASPVPSVHCRHERKTCHFEITGFPTEVENVSAICRRGYVDLQHYGRKQPAIASTDGDVSWRLG